jgi:hypothetical protein
MAMSSLPVRLVKEEMEREVNSVPFWWHSLEINGEFRPLSNAA